MFAIYNNVTRGSLINFIFFVSLSFCCCCCCCCCCGGGGGYFFPFFFLFFSFHLPTTYLSLVITLLLLLLQLCLLIFINITGILEKSSGGEFQARNSSGMVYPYLSR